VLRVGLTGGIACGKSHVLRRLADQGFHTLDLDAVAREVTAPDTPALAEIAAVFGARVVGPDGSLSRAALAALVFADPLARARLNAIVHPRVRAAEARWASAFAGRPDAVLVTDAALLVEAGAHLRFDRLVVVHCDAGQQLSRLRARDGLDERAARARIEAQMPLAEKRGFAHLEVDTSGPIEETDRAAEKLAGDLARLALRERDERRTRIDGLLGGLVHGPRAGPRGMTPASFLAAAAGAGGLEMEDLARRLTPPARGPWYRTAAEAAPGGTAAPLAVAVAAWGLCRGPADPPFLAAAAGSVARLSHTDPGARADACLLALVAQDVAVRGGDTAKVEAWAEGHAPLATRFGGAKPSGRLAPVWKAARHHPSDPEGAARECARHGGEPTLASALAGLGVPVEPSLVTQTLRTALEAAAFGAR
jgi:dephospho-CoA kinase